MASDPGHAGSDLKVPQAAIAQMDFFELLRQLESEDHRFGRSGATVGEPVRLGQTPRMDFAASDVAEMYVHGDDRPADVAVNVIGLIGPEGPMPLHLTRWVLERMSIRWFAGDSDGALADTSFLDFINLLQHRMIALYWRAWADARPDVQIAFGRGGSVSAMMRALAGIGLPGSETGDQRQENAKLRHATSLNNEVHDPGRLAGYLTTVLSVPVTLVEFVGYWIDVPDHLLTRLGQAHAGLGTGAVAGTRVYDRQSRAELRLGPLTSEEFLAILDDPETWDRMRHAVIFAEGKGLQFGLRLVLKAEEVPAAQLGMARLGRTAWLQPDGSRDADDFIMPNVATAAAPAKRAS